MGSDCFRENKSTEINQFALGVVRRAVGVLSLCVVSMTVSACTLGTPELLIILAIVVVLFGASRLPQLGKALGESLKGFKKASEEFESARKNLPEESASIQEAEVESVDHVNRS